VTFFFHSEAEDEFNAAIDYYESCEYGLGQDFALEVFSAIQKVINYPFAWPVVEEEVRRCFVNRFPFGIIYSIEQDEIFILALMHLRRRPDYWKDRL
jgi:hypothetical protein